jgi:hypothetical protein
VVDGKSRREDRVAQAGFTGIRVSGFSKPGSYEMLIPKPDPENSWGKNQISLKLLKINLLFLFLSS